MSNDTMQPRVQGGGGMSKVYATYVVEFEDSSPAVHAGMEILGGQLVAVQFNDALEELNALLEVSDE
jgi:hypothetical protein